MEDRKRIGDLIKAVQWLGGNDTGTSSKTILFFMLEIKSDFFRGPPRDGADFARCYRLLDIFPEWKSRMKELAKVQPDWLGFVNNWSRLEEMYLKDWEKGINQELYDFIKKIQEAQLLVHHGMSKEN